VHKFYDEYYFRPKAALRIVWTARKLESEKLSHPSA
jgi:hypothetical protein